MAALWFLFFGGAMSGIPRLARSSLIPVNDRSGDGWSSRRARRKSETLPVRCVSLRFVFYTVGRVRWHGTPQCRIRTRRTDRLASIMTIRSCVRVCVRAFVRSCSLVPLEMKFVRRHPFVVGVNRPRVFDESWLIDTANHPTAGS